MKFTNLFFLLLCNLLLVAQNDSKIQLAEVWLEAQYQYDRLPGISVAIIEKDNLVWSNGFGQAAEGVATKDETIYSICSISKLFTATGILQLRDAGKLRLDEPISTYLPWFKLVQQYDDSGPITVRSLLTHSSGLPRESNHPYWTGPDFPFPSSEEIIDQLKNQQTLYPASTYFQYSNLGLTLLGEIIKSVSGQDYSGYITEHILNPLSMNDTRTYMPGDLYGLQLAEGKSAMTRAGHRNDVKMFEANGIAAAAGFSSTVLDLAKFAIWQNNVLKGTDQTDVLKSSTLREMQRVHWMDPDWDTSWGLGYSVYQSNGRTMVGHGGSCPGYRSTLSIDTKARRAVVVMINASGTNPGKYARALHNIWEQDHPKDSLPDFSDYEGLYSAQPWSSEGYVMQWGKDLISLSLPVDNPTNWTKLKYMEKDAFRRVRDNDELGEEYIFERNKEGKIFKYSSHNNFRTKLRP